MNNAIYIETILHGTDLPHTESQLREIQQNSKRIVSYFPGASMCATGVLVTRVPSAGRQNPGQTDRFHIHHDVYRETYDPATCSRRRHPAH